MTIGLSGPLLFGAGVALLAAKFQWPWRWLVSGAPLLTFTVLLGAAHDHRILPSVPLWTLLPTLNLVYVVASTSWLLYGLFVTLCYPVILMSALFQSAILANFFRRRLRRLLTQFQFVNDRVAFFDIPALEIDDAVDGLMVVRGITLSLSSLTLIAHGVEVGIKLSDDMELALQTETVTVELFRRITISPVYANLKGGQYEMTFGDLDTRAGKSNGEAFMVSDSAILKRANTTGDVSRPPLVKMTSKMTNDAPMKDVDSVDALASMSKLAPDNEAATRNYNVMLKWIEKTNLIRQCDESARQLRKEQGDDDLIESENNVRAAVSTMLHSEPSIPHPPAASVKVTTLRNMSSPRTKRLMHRMPMLLRLLLSPMSYFHPITIDAIVAAGSGKWITAQLEENVFKEYASENAELRRLEKRVLSWLSDANFVLSLVDITAQANVPFIPTNDVICYLAVSDLLAFRTLDDGNLRPIQVVHTGGADATFAIPSFLLPHHEHLIPPVPTKTDELYLKREIEKSGGSPKEVQKENDLQQIEKDETNIRLSVHARLPATFDQELLNFTAALVKATKVVELEKSTEVEKGTEPMEPDSSNAFRDWAHSVNKGMREGVKKVVAEGMVHDRWIAKMVGKITKKLQTAQGEIGYSGNIPVALQPYRLADGHPEAEKILG